jgi:hypothetical protein
LLTRRPVCFADPAEPNVADHHHLSLMPIKPSPISDVVPRVPSFFVLMTHR